MMRFTIVLLSLALLLPACKKETPVRITGEAQGTYYMVTYYDHENRNFKHEIDSLLDAFDKSVSLWVPNSIISQVNNNEPNILIDKFFTDNFFISQQVANETGGAFDFTVGPLVRAWGFSNSGKLNMDSTIVDSLLDITGYKRVSLFKNQLIKKDSRIKIDFNAVAQGYSVDMLAEHLKSKGLENFIVDIGGEVIARGKKPNGSSWKVGIEKPAKDITEERDLTIVIKLDSNSVATSGNYRKFYEKDGIRYSHIISPKTGYPAMNRLLSATVVYNNTALADAYATSFMIMGLEESVKFVESKPEMEAFFIFINDDGQYETQSTKGFNSLIVKEY